eukprot:2022361-Alexandrium_andersonii.AAC.1
MSRDIAVVRKGSGRLAGLGFIGFQASLSVLPTIPPWEAGKITACLLRLHGGVTKARAEEAAAGQPLVLPKERLRLR